jgi:hypothetical protein
MRFGKVRVNFHGIAEASMASAFSLASQKKSPARMPAARLISPCGPFDKRTCGCLGDLDNLQDLAGFRGGDNLPRYRLAT